MNGVNGMSEEAERAVDAHIKSVWDMLQAGRDAAIVHRGGDASATLPSWESLDEGSRVAFMLLSAGPLLQLLQVAEAIKDDLGNDGGGF